MVPWNVSSRRKKPHAGSAAFGRLGQVLVAVKLLVLLLGCSNNPYADADSTEKVLYQPFLEAPKSLDPAVAYDTAAHEILGNVCDTLLEYHYLERPYQLIPGLATEVPKAVPLPDGKVRYLFELRDDMWFEEDACFELSQPGAKTRRVLAEDVAFQLLRIADPEVNSPVGESFGVLVGFEEFAKRLVELRKQEPLLKKASKRDQYRRAGGVVGLRVLDERRLELTLSRAYPQLLYWFAMPFSTPVPWEAIAFYNGQNGQPHFADHPVGTGPFRLTRYEKQGRMVLSRSKNWYGVRHPEWKAPGATYPDRGEPGDAEKGYLRPSAVGKPLPFLPRIDYRREKESIPSFNKFLQGYYDASGVIRESFDKVIRNDQLSPEMQALGMRLDKSVTAAVYYIGFNMTDRVVGDPGAERSRKLRQALSSVIDFNEYARVFLNGRGVPAESPLAPGIFGYDESYKNPFRRIDVARAKQLLVEAGYPGGIDPKTSRPLHLTFDVPDTSPDGRLRYQFWVNQWRTIGVDVEVVGTTYNKFQQKIRDGAYQIFTWGWVADYPDAENFLFLLWSEMARSKSNGPNSANFQNAEFDRLFVQAKALADGPEKLELIRKMRGILEQEAPWIPLFHPETYALYHGFVHNVKVSGLSVPTSKYRDIDADVRQEQRRAWNKPILWPAFAFGLLAIALFVPGLRTYLKERR